MESNSVEHVLLLDTCVWLDLAKDSSGNYLIRALRELMEYPVIKIIVPTIIKNEFLRNKKRAIDIGRQKLSQDIRRIKKIIELYSGNEKKSDIISGLDDVNHKLSIMTDVVSGLTTEIEKIILNADEIEITKDIKIKAAERAILKKAPFHKNKNSFADAVIVETFFDQQLSDETKKYYFITHNTKDFSSVSDNRVYHEDFSEFFSSENVFYSTNLTETINSISPELLYDFYVVDHEWHGESSSRGLYEIIEEINALTDKVWYNRHCEAAQAIEDGSLKVIPQKEHNNYEAGTVRDDIWKGALKAAIDVEQRYPDTLGPWTDFEWGVLNGKLSALRWVLGDDWDMLDT